MKVCFDVSAAMAQGAGVSRYIRELLPALLALQQPPHITLFNNRRPNQNLDGLPPVARNMRRIEVPLQDKQWRMRILSNTPIPQMENQGERFDVFHGTDVIAPQVQGRLVVTVHDLTTWLFPQYHTIANRWYQRLALPLFMRRATLIIADSHSTKHDLVRLTNTPPAKISVIHLAVDHARFSPRPPAEARRRIDMQLKVTDPFFLAVGTLEPRKNLPTLLHAFARSGLRESGYKLVLTGAKGWKVDALLRSLKLDPRLSESVILTGYVPDDLLPDLYAAATGFVYPSFYEGFGLPVLEAMACGAPVIASNTSSLPEVTGDAALLVAPADIEAISLAMQTLAGDATQSSARRERSLKQAAKFDWSKTARETVEVYREANSLHRAK